MCGIGGILRTDGQPIPEEWLDAIDARIAWRGPDGAGRFRDRVEVVDADGKRRVVEVAFVHRRLSIIDHEGGKQPMVSERGRNEKEGLVAVVFNGCIYNHRELRRELEGKGHRFVTDHSDTEVLIYGWREWGSQLPTRLEGMYAFALWERRLASLYVARDWFGEKPLFVRQWPGQWSERPLELLGFSSDAESLERIRPVNWNEDPLALRDWIGRYLSLGVVPLVAMTPDARDGQVKALSGGFAHTWTCAAKPAVHRAHELNEFTPNESTTEEDIESLLDQAVGRRLEADVPLGCFLSGGVDSSLIAHFARKHDAAIQTFSVRMPDDRYDESQFANAVARHLGVRHEILEVAPDPADDLITLMKRLGQPFGDSSVLPTYWVSRAARQHVTVALSGDGGDELFVGYERHMAARMLARHRWILQFLPSALLYKAHPKSLRQKLGRLGEMARDYRFSTLAAMSLVFTVPQLRALLEGEPESFVTCSPRGDALQAIRWRDLHVYLTSDLLRKVDVASMSVALEVRAPFLDRDLARAALLAPIDQLLPGGQRKGLLRQIARKYLPKEIVDRPKMGFAIPIGEWFRSDFGGMKTLLLDHLNSVEPFGPVSLNRKAVQKFIDEHMSGKRDHGQRLFTLLTLSIWAQGLKDR